MEWLRQAPSKPALRRGALAGGAILHSCALFGFPVVPGIVRAPRSALGRRAGEAGPGTEREAEGQPGGFPDTVRHGSNNPGRG